MSVLSFLSELPQWVNGLSAVCSIFGLGVSVWVLIDVKNIKQNFKRKARLPELLNDLREVERSLSKNLTEWEADPNAASAAYSDLAKVVALLKNIQPKLTKQNIELKKLIEELNAYTDNASLQTLSKEKVWAISLRFGTVFESLRQLNKDDQWD